MNERRRLLAVLCACLAVIVAGCGGGDDDDDDVPMQDVPAELAEVFCAEVMPCMGPMSDMFLNGADCVQSFTAQFQDEMLSRWEQAIEAGTTQYNGGRVQDCLDAFAEIGCTFGASRPPAVCDEVLEGNVALGGECNAGVECSGIAYCKFEDACPGTCTALEAAGGDCEESDHCQDGLACMDGNCTAPAAEGERCGLEDDPDCQFGLMCTGADDDAGTPGTCQPVEDLFIGEEDDACNLLSFGPLCRQGLSCVLESIAVGPPFEIGFVCARGVGSGETCRPGFPDPCPDGELCDANLQALETEGTCVSMPDEGEPCARTLAGTGCAPGLACVEDTCVTMGRIGESCRADAGCFSGTCDGDTCAAPPLCEYDD